MSDWTTPADLRAQVLRRWDRDQLLTDPLGSEETFPLRLTLRAPSPRELSDRFDAARAWAADLQAGARAGYRLVLREVRHRVIGQNSLPGEAWVDTLEDALRLIGKAREGRSFNALTAVTRERDAALLPWLLSQPRRALALADDWSKLLDVVSWLREHPRPGIYLRQVDLPGIHSKFIEAQRGVLAELLDQVLPDAAIDASARGASQFARRYGFRDKPARVRLRFLDPRHAPWAPGNDSADADYTISQQAFVRLAPAARRVFVTENEINFLAFPPLADSLLVFGAGYGFDILAQAAWLHQRALHYWGDIDTHGFAILNQLRAHWPHARSLLMDHDTLLAHRSQWTIEPQPTQRDLPLLDDGERRVYDDLRWKRLQDDPVRLEQERITFGCVQRAIQALG